MSLNTNLDREERYIPHLLSMIPEELIVPLFPSFSGFPWKNFSELLQKQFSIPDFDVEFKNASWRAPIIGNDLERFRYLEILLNPLKTPIYISFMPEDLKVMMGMLLGKSHKPWALTNIEEQNAIIYLALEAASCFSKMPEFKSLGVRIVGFSKPIEERIYQVQFKLGFHEQEAWLQLLIPSSFQREFSNHFQNQPLNLSMMKMTSKIPLDLSIEIGSSHIDVKSWKQVKTGDVLMLDRCTYDPHSKKGTGHLSLQDKPLLIVKCKGSEVKILDLAYFKETTMDNSDDTIFDENNESFGEEPENLKRAKNQDHHHPGDPDYQEEMNEEYAPPSEETQKALSEEVMHRDLSMEIKVEIGKIQMSLSDLLQLRPGNTLSLSVKPEEPVRLVHLGKCIARGDLVKLGEVLGVRITQI